MTSELRKRPYSELLKHEKWQKLRERILERDNYTCRMCSQKAKSLHVHHQFYLPKRLPWEYNDWVFLSLCKSCHLETNQNADIDQENQLGLSPDWIPQEEWEIWFSCGLAGNSRQLDFVLAFENWGRRSGLSVARRLGILEEFIEQK